MYSELNNEASNDETSLEGNETETSDIVASGTAGSYGSTPAAKDELDDGLYVPVCGLIFYIMSFLGLACLLSMSETLSVAIVDMVNDTTVTEADIAMTNESEQEECPRDPELEHEGGEFDWNRQQQTVVLSAYYFGFGFTLVCGSKKYYCIVTADLIAHKLLLFVFQKHNVLINNGRI